MNTAWVEVSVALIHLQIMGGWVARRFVDSIVLYSTRTPDSGMDGRINGRMDRWHRSPPFDFLFLLFWGGAALDLDFFSG